MYQLPEILDRSVASEVRDALLELVTEDDVVEIDASKVERLMTPVAQLLVALKMQADEDRKSVQFISPSEAFLDAIKGLGLKKILDIKE